MAAFGQTAAYLEGRAAASILENPYWLNYPNDPKGGLAEVVAARQFVDGWCEKVRSSIESTD